MPDAPVWLNTKTAAAYLGMTPVTLYRLVDRGDVAGYLTGRVGRYRQEDLDRFLEDARTGRRDGTRQSPTVENRRRSEQNPSHLDDDLGSNPPTLAEGAGFEPAGPARAHWFSRPAHSSALPSLRGRGYRSATMTKPAGSGRGGG